VHTRFCNRWLLATAVLGGSAHAIEPIPEQPGWSGFVTLGVGVLSAETNQVAGIDAYGIEIGNATISSLSAPESKSAAMPQINLSLNYTFATQTQVFLGNSLESVVQFDTASLFGVRQQFRDKSILELSVVSTPFISPVQVWQDPYVVGVERQETDRTSRGLRIEYDRILGTGLGVRYTQRETKIDEERSGTVQLGLSAADAALLSREGDVKQTLVSYRFPRAGQNLFEARLGLTKEDLDGKAMSGDQYEFQLTHVYLGERFTLASNLFLATQEYDAVNPVFNQTREDDTWGVGFVLFDKRIFNSKNWIGQATLVHQKQSSNVAFYEASSTIFALGAQYRF
jgi:Protein of unknown function (DUF2860)